jgi:hypothetical protein
MITREMMLFLALSSAPETWTSINPVAQSVTGRVTFTPSEIAFQNGKVAITSRRRPAAVQVRAEEKEGLG